MLPTADEAMRELELAGELNPGPWVKHSVNVGIAARKIAEKISSLDPEKAYHREDKKESLTGRHISSACCMISAGGSALWISRRTSVKATGTAWKKDGMRRPGSV